MQLHVWGERRQWLNLNLCLVNHFPSCYKNSGGGESLHVENPTSSHCSSAVCWDTDHPGVHLDLTKYLSKHGSTKVTVIKEFTHQRLWCKFILNCLRYQQDHDLHEDFCLIESLSMNNYSGFLPDLNLLKMRLMEYTEYLASHFSSSSMSSLMNSSLKESSTPRREKGTADIDTNYFTVVYKNQSRCRCDAIILPSSVSHWARWW